MSKSQKIYSIALSSSINFCINVFSQLCFCTSPLAPSEHIIPYVFGSNAGFPLAKMTQIFKLVFWNDDIRWILPFQNDSKNLDPPYKDGCRFKDCFGKENLYFITENNCNMELQ